MKNYFTVECLGVSEASDALMAELDTLTYVMPNGNKVAVFEGPVYGQWEGHGLRVCGHTIKPCVGRLLLDRTVARDEALIEHFHTLISAGQMRNLLVQHEMQTNPLCQAILMLKDEIAGLRADLKEGK